MEDLKLKDSIPFDPGYSPLSFSFMENIAYITRDYNNLKALPQKKFKLTQLEPSILDLITKSTSFYLGCMLWGGFIHCRFKNEPKEISGNHTLKLSDDDKKALDCAEETKFTLNYIEMFDRDCKYFLKKPAKVSAFIIKILENYNEFAELNENFINVKNTADIKLPKALAHFKNLTNDQLDDLYNKIMAVIDSKKVENLLEIGFFE